MSRKRATATPASSARAPGLAWIAAGIAGLTLLVYAGVLSNAFVNYDDDVYVTGNAHVLRGLDGASLAWAATATEASNWHPLTWLSHMLDVRLFGLDAGKHHATSLVLHAANAVLLFLLFVRMTGAVWRSALVAALFAVHPLHVESVAWIAERKDVLSTLFWLLTLAAWLRFVDARTAPRYLLVVASFALGLMAKPMLVSFPFTLLLLDVWPLSRTERGVPALVAEKAPLFAMAAASCIATVIAQQRGGAVQSLASFTFTERLANALVAYAVYLGRTVWPASLAVLYPHGYVPLVSWDVAGAIALLGAVTAAVVVVARRVPAAPFGWAWYLGTLVPVIGLVQVGGQATADRYTYVPLIGIFVAVAWGLAAIVGGNPRRRAVAVASSVAALLVLAVVARAQVRTWRDSQSLFERAIAVTRDNWLAENNLGRALSDRGRNDEAIAHYTAALRIAPDYTGAQLNLGNALVGAGRLDEAIAHYLEAVRLSPASATLRGVLGTALARAGRPAEAVDQYRQALRLEPDDARILNDLGLALARTNRAGEAIEAFERAIRIRPDDAEAHNNLGVAFANANRMPEALAQFEQAVRIRPGFDDARANLQAARAALDRGP